MHEFTQFLVAATLLSSSASAADEDPVGIEWIRKTAVQMSGDVERSPAIAAFTQKLGKGRVYGIGEATHGTHEDQAIKAAIIRQLVANGSIDTVAVEANRSAGASLDAYVRHGRGTLQQSVTGSGLFKVFQTREFAGLIEWLANWNRSHPHATVRIVGIDLQDGGNDADAALVYIRSHDAALAAKLAAPLVPILPSNGKRARRLSDWIAGASEAEVKSMGQALDALEAAFVSGRATWGADPQFADASYAATVAAQNLRAFELDRGDAKLMQAPPEYISRRDRFMAANLLALVGDQGRAALWAHDLHVAESLPPPAVEAGFATVGSTLAKTLGDQYRSVGFTWTTATVRAARRGEVTAAQNALGPPPVEEIALRNDGEDMLGRPFALAFPDPRITAAMVAPGAAPAAPLPWAMKPYWRGWIGSSVDPATFQSGKDGDFPNPIAYGHDLLIWVRTMTPSRALASHPATP